MPADFKGATAWKLLIIFQHITMLIAHADRRFAFSRSSDHT